MAEVEPYELAGIRPKAVIHRFWSDGSYEVFWELEHAGPCCLKMYWAGDADRTVAQTVRLPPGPIPPLPEYPRLPDSESGA